jgi:hypothetical protein
MVLYSIACQSKKIAWNLSKVRTIENAFEVISVETDWVLDPLPRAGTPSLAAMVSDKSVVKSLHAAL